VGEKRKERGGRKVKGMGKNEDGRRRLTAQRRKKEKNKTKGVRKKKRHQR
jgi:hypothetical protein